MALNETLYELLEDEFGQVRMANDGEAMNAGYGSDAQTRKPRLMVYHPGEYYCVHCPYCNDLKQRLYINHRWGVIDAVTGDKNLWLACCFNDQCLANDTSRYQELYHRVYGFKNANLRGRTVVILSPPSEAAALAPVSLPGTCIGIDKLPHDHPAVTYLRGRGYNVTELAKDHKITYCCESLADYRAASGRIIIPIFMCGELVGWQGRYVGDIDWKATHIPKYYTMPRMPKRLVLYNFDLARHFPFGVLCEGTSDVWRVGKPAVALLGKSLSADQSRLIISAWGQGAVFVMFDGDKPGMDASQDVVHALKGRVRHVIPIRLPDGMDPGGCSTDYLWSALEGAGKALGFDLLGSFCPHASASDQQLVNASPR